MGIFQDSTLILFASPLYLILIGTEIIVSYLHDRHYYSIKGTLTNVYLATVNVALDLLMRTTWFAVLAYIYPFHFLNISNSWVYWFSLLVLQDLAFYFLHRVDHGCRLFWAIHVTHHSSAEFNLTVGFRPSVLQPFYRFAWFLPLTLLGFRPEDIILMYSITQLYGILVHTRCVGKLGLLEWVFCTPSHHRVHHATNSQYIDKNLGMVFIVWDRIFGTFAEEKEEVRFGLNGQAPTSHPLRVVFHEWQSMWADLCGTNSIKTKLMYIFGPPGWQAQGRVPGSLDAKRVRAVK
jgi:sterol desaturase/sphingolipid hydroxylase (fatty acid hydroxylase superfamily)